MSQTAQEQSEQPSEAASAAPAEQAGDDAVAAADRSAKDDRSAKSEAVDHQPSAVALADNLSPYARSFFRVTAPVSVNLAHKKESVREIVEMAPGSILTFDKGCEELLELAIGQRVIAVGEAVKIGDKFGFRVVRIVPPEEQFRVVAAEAHAQAQATRAPTIVNLAGS